MAFSLEDLKRAVTAGMTRLPSLLNEAGVTAYGALCTTTLWPLVEALGNAGPSPVGAVLSGLGSNLVAGHLQKWMADQASGPDIAVLAAEAAAQNGPLRDELDTLLEKLDVLAQAQTALVEGERQTFLSALREEMSRLGNLDRFAVALVDRSIAVQGPVTNSILVTGNHVTVSIGGPISRDKAAILRPYLESLWRECGALRLRGIDQRATEGDEEARIGLAHIYVGLDTTAHIGDEDPAQPRPLGALEAVLRERRCVLLGEPGSGKSTFLNYLTLCLAGHALDGEPAWLRCLPGWPATATLPIPVVLRDFARKLPDGVTQPSAQHVQAFIRGVLEAECVPDAAAVLEERLEDGGAVVFFDGLDEVPTNAQRAAVRHAVAAFATRYARSRHVVTCRTLAYQDRAWQLAAWPSFTLAAFDRAKIAAFIEAWYAELVRLAVVNETTGRELSVGLRAAVKRPELELLAGNPLLLTQMAVVHKNEGRLPDARAQLYEKTVDLLLWRWEDIKRSVGGPSPGLRALLDEVNRRDIDLLKVLRALAFDVHRARGATGTTVADIPESQLENALRTLHPDKSKDWAGRVIHMMKVRAGLLLERAPEVYAFPHRTFQEYLAGSHLAVQYNFAQQVRKLLEEGAFWREAVLLAVGRMVSLGEEERPLMLAAELCPKDSVNGDDAARSAWRAGEVLAEVGAQCLAGSELGRELAHRVPRALVSVLSSGYLQPVERAVAGDTLAVLGDPRFRTDAWFLPNEPLLGFVEIPAGRFGMGEGEQSRTVTLPTYFIGRFPVTVAQFRAFVDEGGQVADDAVREPATRPVRWVHWREALAYTVWLTEKLRGWDETPEPLAGLLRGTVDGKRWRVTLPSEAEWERAARGTRGRPYPWGDEEPDANRANFSATGIGRPSPVGCFPSGATLEGIHDLSGNVWEWTRSLYKDGRDDLTGSDGKRHAARGGAFDLAARLVRAAVRSPDWDVVIIGFRVVVSPF